MAHDEMSMHQHHATMMDAHVANIMKSVDADKNGEMTLDEAGALPSKRHDHSHINDSENYGSEDIATLIRDADTDKSGGVDAKELSAFLETSDAHLRELPSSHGVLGAVVIVVAAIMALRARREAQLLPVQL